MTEEALERALRVKERHLAELLSKANVVSVGVGYRQRAGQLTEEVVLVVNVMRKLPLYQLRPQDVIPPVLDGVPVDVQESGAVRAL